MKDDRNQADGDSTLDPRDVNSSPADAPSTGPELDANDEIPVPIAMSAAEIDERAQAVEAMRGSPAPTPLDESSPPA